LIEKYAENEDVKIGKIAQYKTCDVDISYVKMGAKIPL
jgi:hypothetical protein